MYEKIGEDGLFAAVIDFRELIVPIRNTIDICEHIVRLGKITKDNVTAKNSTHRKIKLVQGGGQLQY